jgi:Arc/MetJ-type ribon-helix-helix transcriptional regulator
MLLHLLATDQPQSYGDVLGPYYVLGAILAGLSCILVGRQLLRKLRERWVGEDTRERSIQENTRAVQAMDEKLDTINTKLWDHENRLQWVERELPNKRPWSASRQQSEGQRAITPDGE